MRAACCVLCVLCDVVLFCVCRVCLRFHCHCWFVVFVCCLVVVRWCCVFANVVCPVRGVLFVVFVVCMIFVRVCVLCCWCYASFVLCELVRVDWCGLF